jgi:small-conductance mechanosensitive channel
LNIFSQEIPYLSKWFADIEFTTVISSALKIAIVLFICFIAIKIGKSIIKGVFGKVSNVKNSKRADTLATVSFSVWRYFVYFITVMIILSILDINIAPVLASAGVAGIAIGFGAQSLVKDVITGFFMLFENYYEVGDYVEAGGVKGFVEEVGLRSTKIRDWAGEQHICPNGQLTIVTNYSRGNLSSIVQIPVSYEGDLSMAMRAINQICYDMKDQYPQITDGPVVLGLGSLEPSHMTINISFSAALNDKFEIERQLRQRSKEALDKIGISIPYSYSKIILDTAELIKDNDPAGSV